jgi:hypothetical protein
MAFFLLLASGYPLHHLHGIPFHFMPFGGSATIPLALPPSAALSFFSKCTQSLALTIKPIAKTK